MKIHTNTAYQMTEKIGEYVLLSDTWHEYKGPVAFSKGASDDQKSLGSDQMAFFKKMTDTYSTVFANSDNILSGLKAQWQPVVDKGINQYGFSAPQDSFLRTQATTQTAAEYKKAAQMTGEHIAAVGGGNVALPSGLEAATQRDIAVRAAESQSEKQLGITAAGYETGRQNFFNASKVLSSAPGELFNPVTAAGNSAVGAGEAAGKTQSQIAEEDAAASPWATVGGILGGGVSSFLGNPGLFGKKPVGGAPAATA